MKISEKKLSNMRKEIAVILAKIGVRIYRNECSYDTFKRLACKVLSLLYNLKSAWSIFTFVICFYGNCFYHVEMLYFI